MRFFGLFWAKMTKIGIPNPKLNVTNDYQQFLEHFEWFLSLFQISDTKHELLLVKLKLHRAGRVAFFTICLVNLIQIVSKNFRVGSRTGLRT